MPRRGPNVARGARARTRVETRESRHARVHGRATPAPRRRIVDLNGPHAASRGAGITRSRDRTARERAIDAERTRGDAERTRGIILALLTQSHTSSRDGLRGPSRSSARATHAHASKLATRRGSRCAVRPLPSRKPRMTGPPSQNATALVSGVAGTARICARHLALARESCVHSAPLSPPES